MKTINEILPVAGWSAYAVGYTKNTLSIKYKFEDVSYLLCPKTRKATLSPHQSYHLRIRGLSVGEKQTILEIEAVECWCYECNKFHSVRPDELHYSMAMHFPLSQVQLLHCPNLGNAELQNRFFRKNQILLKL